MTKLSVIGDGVYTPRDYQVDAFNWLDTHWKDEPYKVLHASVGSGKSSIIKTLQRKHGGIIINPNNVLVDQYTKTYKELNPYIGASNYRCDNLKATCSYVQSKYSCPKVACGTCPLTLSRMRFDKGEPTVTNLMMAWHIRDKIKKQVRYVDEAHQVPNMIRQMTNKTMLMGVKQKKLLKKLNLSIPDLVSDFNFGAFLDASYAEVSQALYEAPDELKTALEMEQYSIATIQEHFKEHPELFVRIPEGDKLHHFSVYLSKSYLQGIFGRNAVLLSGTLLKHDLAEMLGNNYAEYTVPPPISNEARPIILSPSEFKHNKAEMNPELLADRIIGIFEATGLNTLTHTTYGLAKQVEPFIKAKFKGRLFMYTEPEHKTRTLDAYMKAASGGQGNMLLGAGLVEGLDLKDGLARVNIITKLLFPHLGDPFIQKRMSLSDGRMFYVGETLKSLMQSVGRTTRGPDDYSLTYILDNNAQKLIDDGRKLGLIDNSFTSSILRTTGDKQNHYKRLETYVTR